MPKTYDNIKVDFKFRPNSYNIMDFELRTEDIFMPSLSTF